MPTPQSQEQSSGNAAPTPVVIHNATIQVQESATPQPSPWDMSAWSASDWAAWAGLGLALLLGAIELGKVVRKHYLNRPRFRCDVRQHADASLWFSHPVYVTVRYDSGEDFRLENSRIAFRPRKATTEEERLLSSTTTEPFPESLGLLVYHNGNFIASSEPVVGVDDKLELETGLNRWYPWELMSGVNDAVLLRLYSGGRVQREFNLTPDLQAMIACFVAERKASYGSVVVHSQSPVAATP